MDAKTMTSRSEGEGLATVVRLPATVTPADGVRRTRQRARRRHPVPALDRRTPVADLPEFLSPEEFRAVVGIGRNTMYDLLRRGEVPHLKLGRTIRIPKSALHVSTAIAAEPLRAGGE
jgi:excisionase family DNA binding protein